MGKAITTKTIYTKDDIDFIENKNSFSWLFLSATSQDDLYRATPLLLNTQADYLRIDYSGYFPASCILSNTYIRKLRMPFTTAIYTSSYTTPTGGTETTFSLPNLEEIYCDVCSTIPKLPWIVSNAYFPEATTIMSSAFKGNGFLINPSFPKLKSLTFGCFEGCIFSTCSFPECSRIDAYAFSGCSNLITINLPKATYIDSTAFNGCSYISSVYAPLCNDFYIGANVSFVSSLDVGGLSMSYGSSVGKIYSKVSYFRLHSGGRVTPKAFYQNTLLSSITVDNVLVAGSSAFAGCSNLETINCSSYLTFASFESSAFYGCTKLKSLPGISIYGTSNVFFGYYAFAGCYSLNFPNITISNISRAFVCVSDHAFDNNYVITSLCVSSYIFKYIGGFNYCNNLSIVDVCVTSLPTYAFNGCSKLTTVTLNQVSVGLLTYYLSSTYGTPFANCSRLTTLILNQNVVLNISSSTFLSRTGITSTTGCIYVPSSLVSSYKEKTGWYYFRNRIFSIV